MFSEPERATVLSREKRGKKQRFQDTLKHCPSESNFRQIKRHVKLTKDPQAGNVCYEEFFITEVSRQLGSSLFSGSCSFSLLFF